jgi:hypothetical protein
MPNKTPKQSEQGPINFRASFLEGIVKTRVQVGNNEPTKPLKLTAPKAVDLPMERPKTGEIE